MQVDLAFSVVASQLPAAPQHHRICVGEACVHVAEGEAFIGRWSIGRENVDALEVGMLWLIDQVGHPHVGACVDTVNSMMVLEDPMKAIENLVPRSFTNHFCDHRIERDQFGCRFTGVACGDGDIDLKRALDLIETQSAMERINIEVEWDAGTDPPEEARRRERVAVERSIRYCRDVLGI